MPSLAKPDQDKVFLYPAPVIFLLSFKTLLFGSVLKNY